MRKYQKKAVKDCIRALNQAHEAIRQSMDSENPAGVLELLSQCQDVAIQLGTMLEGIMGEGYEAVKRLEDYCELVFQIYTQIHQDHMLSSEEVYHKLGEQIALAEGRIDQEKERLEVVFLPYQAAMWDSLESVWMAAEADEDCDAYVIPIPYYTRNADLSLGELHYEGDRYPENVPITGYEAYSLEQHRPDVIFIHNPYDGYNQGTSVHPFFYSENLKKYTDCLVYVPYYSTSGGMSANQVWCPAYDHADYIVIQAERYRRFFDPKLPAEKLIALGSPNLDEALGIYDDTPDITGTIALCDAYIGDAGTSVTSLFGIAGKPLFILNNDIHGEPKADDWKGWIIKGGVNEEQDSWMVTQGNKLYHASAGSSHYRFHCDLSEWAYGDYYGPVIFIGDQTYVCPLNAEDILLIGSAGIEKKIPLKPCLEQNGAFCGAVAWEDQLFLIPNRYPALVRYDTKREKIEYIDLPEDVFTGMKRGERCCGGFCVHGENLYLGSPVDQRILKIHAMTGRQEVLTVPRQGAKGCMAMASDKEQIWLLPYDGRAVVSWNPGTGEVWEYKDYPADMKCIHPAYACESEERPFINMAFYKEYVYLAPYFSNMFIRLNRNKKELTEWKPPVKLPEQEKNGYFTSWTKGYFSYQPEELGNARCHLFSAYDKKYYDIDFETKEAKEVEMAFDLEELLDQEPGFREHSQWLRYACQETALNSLKDFLDGKIHGNAFDRERQIRAYEAIAANADGSCGEKVYQFVNGSF